MRLKLSFTLWPTLMDAVPAASCAQLPPGTGARADWTVIEARSRETLWVRQLYAGLVGFIGGGASGLAYVIDTWDTRPNRGWLVALALFAIVQSILVWVLRRRFVTSRQRTALFVTWNLGTYAIVALASILDGGVRSPIALMWVLPVIYMLMGYSRQAIVLCGAAAIGLYLTAAALTPGGAPPGTIAMQLAVLLTAIFMVLLGAIARDEREGILRDLRDRLATLATVDALTGCANVRAFQELASGEFVRAARYRHSVSLLAVDVDHFKRINDTRGHLVGDEVLRAVAGTMRAVVRRTDQVGRLGGDEFAVLCPETGERTAARLAERLCVAVRGAPVAGIALTLSVGVCALRPTDEAPAVLRERADAALYEAKRRGRDQYAMYPST